MDSTGPFSSSILPAWSILTTVAMVIVFVSSFRSRYLSFGGESVERAEERSTGLLGIAEG